MLDNGKHIYIEAMNVVYFDYQMGALHALPWFKSYFSAFNIFLHHKWEKDKNTWKKGVD